MNDRELWTVLEAADPAANVSPDLDETESRFVSLLERRETMGTTFRHLETPAPTSPPPTRRRGVLVGALAFVLVLGTVGAVWLVRDPGSDVPPPSAPPATQPSLTAGPADPVIVEPDDPPPVTKVGAPTQELVLDLAAPWARGTILEPDPEASVADLTAISSNGERAVVVGTMMIEHLGDSWGAIWTTDDGRTWNRVAHDPAIFGLTSGGGWTNIRDVTAGGPGFVAIGWNERSEPSAWVSADGITWERSEYIATDDVFLSSVAATESTVVAVGKISSRGAPVIFVSTDGLEWMPALPPQGMDLGVESTMRVATDGASFFTLANGVWRSTDGFEWELVDEAMPPGYRESQFDADARGIVAIHGAGGAVSFLGGDGEWLAGFVGDELDDDAPLGADVEVEAVVALDEGFVVMGSDYTDFSSETGGTVAVAFRSPDGLAWHRMDVELFGGDNGRIRDAARLGGSLIGIGFTSDSGLSYGATWVLDAGAG